MFCLGFLLIAPSFSISNNQMQLLHCLFIYSSIYLFIYVQSQKVAFGDIAQGRGPRPVEQGYKSQCATEKEWAACTDDDWVTHSDLIYDILILFFLSSTKPVFSGLLKCTFI